MNILVLGYSDMKEFVLRWSDMSIKEHRQAAGLTQKQFAETFGIPIDDIKSWDSGRRKPPEWAAKLIIEKLENMKKEQ